MTTHSSEETLHLRVDNVVWREVGDELLVLELSTTTYLTLNGTAKHLWERLASGATVEALVEMLVNRYLITAERARTDADSFLAALATRGLLSSDT